MPRPQFRKPATRGRSTPIVDLLEGRALLNATSLTTKPAIQVHAEVSRPSALPVELEKAEATHARRETAAEAKLVKKEKAAEVKFARQEKAAEAKLAKVGVAAQKKALAGTPFASMSVVKVGNALTDTYLIGNPKRLPGEDTLNATPLAGQFTPAQLETAYGTNLLTNQGEGVTIGIVDELDDSSIVADANVYSSYYGLPQFNTANGPSLIVYKDNYMGTVTTGAGTGVGVETSLDVEVAHAMAPKANILLVEVPGTGETTNAQVFAQLLHGVQYAAGATVAGTPVVSVSLSYGIGEANIGNAAAVTAQNSTFLATGAASLVAVTVSTGDASAPLYPAVSPNVVAVGGTSLFLGSVEGGYGYETAWGGFAVPSQRYSGGAGGGGASLDFAAPTFQSANGVALSAKRTIPDVSLVADPFTGVSIYDSFDGDNWTATGGTSVASPMFAGVLALAQQGRIAAGQPLLTSVQIDSALYSAYTNPTTYADLFNDVTLGKNTNLSARTGNVTVVGFSATTGYDEATGLGSPWAAYMVPYLINGIDPGA